MTRNFTVILILVLAALSACAKNNSSSREQPKSGAIDNSPSVSQPKSGAIDIGLSLEQAKLRVMDVLAQDDSITDITINSFELAEKREDKTIYSLNYSMRPTDPDNFVLAGSRSRGDDGWIHATVFAHFQADGTIYIATSP